MGLGDIASFNKQKYRYHVQEDYNDEELRDNIYKKRRQVAASSCSVGTGVALMHVTGGASAVGSLLAGRNVQIARKKLKILEEEWGERGYEKLPKEFVRDTIVPAAISAAVGVVSCGIDHAAANAMAASSAGAHISGSQVAGMYPNYAYYGPYPDVGYAGCTGYVYSGADQYYTYTTPQTASPNVIEASEMGMKFGVKQAATYGREYYAKEKDD